MTPPTATPPWLKQPGAPTVLFGPTPAEMAATRRQQGGHAGHPTATTASGSAASGSASGSAPGAAAPRAPGAPTAAAAPASASCKMPSGGTADAMDVDTAEPDAEEAARQQPNPAALHTATMRAKDAVEAAVRANMPDEIKQVLRQEFERRRTAEIAAQPLAQRRKLALLRTEAAATGVAKYLEQSKQATLALDKWYAEAKEANDALEAVDRDLADAAEQLHWSLPPHPAELAAEVTQQKYTVLRQGLEGMIEALRASTGTPGFPGVLAQNLAAAEALLSEQPPVGVTEAAPAAGQASTQEAASAAAASAAMAAAEHQRALLAAATAVEHTRALAAAAAAGLATATGQQQAGGQQQQGGPAPLTPTQPYVPQTIAPKQDAHDLGRERSRSPRSAAEIAAAAASQDMAFAAALQPRPTPGAAPTGAGVVGPVAAAGTAAAVARAARTTSAAQEGSATERDESPAAEAEG